MPHDVSEGLGLVPKRTVAYTLTDGTTIERAVSECHLALPEGEGHTPVILGEAGDEALLGVVTLEILGSSFILSSARWSRCACSSPNKSTEGYPPSMVRTLLVPLGRSALFDQLGGGHIRHRQYDQRLLTGVLDDAAVGISHVNVVVGKFAREPA